MALTLAQLAVLKADILADPVLNAHPGTADGAFAIADAYKLDAVPVFWVWRTNVSKREIVSQTSRIGTSFTWNGNGFITRSVGELECWNQLFNSTLSTDPSLPNVRQAFIDIFSGVGNAASNRAHLDAVARRKANRLEKLFATGGGLDTAAGAGTMTVEGQVTYQEVLAARELVA